MSETVITCPCGKKFTWRGLRVPSANAICWACFERNQKELK